MPTITPNPKKALFLAKKQLSELVYDAVNLEGVNYTLPEVQTLIVAINPLIPPVEGVSNRYQQYSHLLF
jgi:hypothetical protein